jgi:heme A synthase
MTKEIIVAVVLITLAVLVLNPMDLWMPDMAGMAIAAGFFVVFAVFAALVWRERPQDEREAVHQMAAGRIAYIAGTGILTLGVAVQAAMHMIDGWLIGALVAMVVAKISARAWHETRN